MILVWLGWVSHWMRCEIVIVDSSLGMLIGALTYPTFAYFDASKLFKSLALTLVNLELYSLIIKLYRLS